MAMSMLTYSVKGWTHHRYPVITHHRCPVITSYLKEQPETPFSLRKRPVFLPCLSFGITQEHPQGIWTEVINIHGKQRWTSVWDLRGYTDLTLKSARHTQREHLRQWEDPQSSSVSAHSLIGNGYLNTWSDKQYLIWDKLPLSLDDLWKI